MDKDTEYRQIQMSTGKYRRRHRLWKEAVQIWETWMATQNMEEYRLGWGNIDEDTVYGQVQMRTGK